MNISDIKQRRAFSIALVEDILVKRPFAKVFTMILLNISSVLREPEEPSFDLVRLARECLKNLASEDLRALHFDHQEVMAEFEAMYAEIQGSLLENELAKIMLRYSKEGKTQLQVSAPIFENSIAKQSHLSSVKKSVFEVPQLSEIKPTGNSPAANGPSALIEDPIATTPLRV